MMLDKALLINIPWKFILIQDLLPFADLITDFISGLNYYEEGHVYWAMCIWALMWLPLVLSMFSDTLRLLRGCRGKETCQPLKDIEMKSLEKDDEAETCQPLKDIEMKSLEKDDEESIRKNSPQSWFQQHEMTILKYLAQIPFVQPVVHFLFTCKLYKAEIRMKKAQMDYKNLHKKYLDESKNIKEEELKKLKTGIVAAAKFYVKWKNEKSRILTIFQGIRLFELIGESGPQAILQLSIALRIGYTDWVQVSKDEESRM